MGASPEIDHISKLALGSGEDDFDDDAHNLDCAVEVVDQEEESASRGLGSFDHDGMLLSIAISSAKFDRGRLLGRERLLDRLMVLESPIGAGDGAGGNRRSCRRAGAGSAFAYGSTIPKPLTCGAEARRWPWA